ncbi:hypothetical protein SPAN111604_06990 [Sphingomonas antarctica]|uniref:PEPxxWA-CTERM sorting domain-containing protein n=1 Tax=Sphingomonas antarctica TaxID=2040274 RepID=UPI0039E73843
MKLGVFFLAAVIATPAAAVTYDPHADFSTAANPNGAYSYGYETSLGGALTLFTNGGAANGQSQTWTSPAVDQYLGVYNPATSILQHPGQSGQYSILRITLGAGSTYTINGGYGNGDNASTDVHVLANGASLFSGAINGGGSSSNFSLKQYFAAGTTIDFAVGNGGNGYNNDSTLLSASVASVPEPASWAMMLGGFGLIGAATRRRVRAVATYA